MAALEAKESPIVVSHQHSDRKAPEEDPFYGEFWWGEQGEGDENNNEIFRDSPGSPVTLKPRLLVPPPLQGDEGLSYDKWRRDDGFTSDVPGETVYIAQESNHQS